jgi:hypothetical protein
MDSLDAGLEPAPPTLHDARMPGGLPMDNAFLDHLVDQGLVTPEVAAHINQKGHYVLEPIGSIAAHHGLLRPDHIDAILDEQRRSGNRFGEIAVRLGFMTEEQVQTLVDIQQFRSHAEIAEALVLAGLVSHEDAVQMLGAFVVGDSEVLDIVSGD